MSPLQLPSFLSKQSDARLVELARAGNERAFETLVGRYRRQLVAASRRILPPHQADDALQNGLLAAWMALQRGTEVNEPKPWLERIVRNSALRALPSAPPCELSEALAGDFDVETDVARRHELRETFAVLAAMPDVQREALLQTAVEGRSYEHVAVGLGMSEGALRGLVHRARVNVRAAVGALVPLPLLRLFSRGARSASSSTPAAQTGAGIAPSATSIGAVVTKGAAALLTLGVAAGGVVGVRAIGSGHSGAAPTVAGGSQATTAEQAAIRMALADDRRRAVHERGAVTLARSHGTAGRESAAIRTRAQTTSSGQGHVHSLAALPSAPGHSGASTGTHHSGKAPSTGIAPTSTHGSGSNAAGGGASPSSQSVGGGSGGSANSTSSSSNNGGSVQSTGGGNGQGAAGGAGGGQGGSASSGGSQTGGSSQGSSGGGTSGQGSSGQGGSGHGSGGHGGWGQGGSGQGGSGQGGSGDGGSGQGGSGHGGSGQGGSGQGGSGQGSSWQANSGQPISSQGSCAHGARGGSQGGNSQGGNSQGGGSQGGGSQGGGSQGGGSQGGNSQGGGPGQGQ